MPAAPACMHSAGQTVGQTVGQRWPHSVLPVIHMRAAAACARCALKACVCVCAAAALPGAALPPDHRQAAQAAANGLLAATHKRGMHP